MKRYHRKKLLLILFLSLATCNIFSQALSFTEINLGSVDNNYSYYPFCQWTDYDNDGDLDVFYAVQNASCVFRNDGNDVFTKVCPGFSAIYSSPKAVWRDFEGDSDLDLFLGSEYYINNGAGVFTKYSLPMTYGSYIPSLDLGDYDNDGDLDMACFVGLHDYSEFKIMILINNNGVFESTNYEFYSTRSADLKWVDYNQDGLLDLIADYGASSDIAVSFYKNMGYEIKPDTTFNIPYTYHTNQFKINYTDIDNDFDPDIIIGNVIMKNNLSVFQSWSYNFYSKYIEPGDCNNDGQIDFFSHSSGSPVLYLNNSGIFNNSNLSFSNFNELDAEWGDYDKDGDLDLVCLGNVNSLPVLKIYKNNIGKANIKPNPPVLQPVVVKGDNAVLSWNKSTDSESPSNTLLYNLYLKRDLDGALIIAPDANVSTGAGKNIFNGNVQQVLQHRIRNLNAGTYTWSVQSIDQGYARSAFTAPSSFTITYTNNVLPFTNQRIKPGQSGNILTASETGAFNSHFWAYADHQGGKYTSLGISTLTYTPNFAKPGDYYVVFRSVIGNDTVTSNEVYVAVLQFEEIDISGITSSVTEKISMVDFDNDNDYDLLLTAFGNSTDNKLYRNDNNLFTLIASFPVTSLNLYYSSSVCFDYNNDGFIDILFSGENPNKYTALYKNNGGLNFTKVASALTGVSNGDIDYADFDNDGDFDIIISGVDNNSETVTKIYQNNGNDSFTELGVVLSPVSNGVSRWIDFNKDNLPDVFLSGRDFSGNPYTKLYSNLGNGQFEPFNYNFENRINSYASWGDYNNDGYPDLIINGKGNSGTPGFYWKRLIYKNLSGKGFEEKLIQINDDGYECNDWYDFDNDGDLDIILYTNLSNAWANHKEQPFSILENTGGDNFVEAKYIRRQTLKSGKYSLDFFKYDADSDLDFIHSTIDRNDATLKLTIFRNLSPAIKTTPTVPINRSARINGNEILLSWSDQNIADSLKYTYTLSLTDATHIKYLIGPQANLTTGYRKVSEAGKIKNKKWAVKNLPVGKYFWQIQSVDNSQNSSAFSQLDSFIVADYFREVTHNIDALNSSAVDWGDYDNDKDMDLLIAGKNQQGNALAAIYKNNGSGSFVKTGINLTGILGTYGSFAHWTDINNDNLLDIVVFGDTVQYQMKFMIYQNLGNDNYKRIYSLNIPGGMYISESQGDIDKDGDIDFVLSPYRLIINNGNLTFTEKSTYYNIYGHYSSIIDLDNDKDNDIVSIFWDDTDFLINQGDMKFTAMTNLLPGIDSYGDIKWFDYNGDDYLDAILTGTSNSYYVTKIFQNNKDLTFTEVNTVLKGSRQGSICIGDYNNDGDFDLFITGYNFTTFTELYDYSTENGYTPIDFPFKSTYYGYSDMADYDNDGDLDIVMTGNGGTILYESTKQWPNTPPASPANLRSSRNGYGILLNWDETSDNESKNGGLSYNIRIGKTAGGTEIVSPLADVTTGYRKVDMIGNAQFNTFYSLDSLPDGKYYWSVQAIDHSFMGGVWATEQSFIISKVRADFTAAAVCSGYSTSFTDKSLSSGGTITGWKWNFGDGQTSTVKNPSHLYRSPGNYTVTLVAFYNEFSDTISKIVPVLARPKAEFNSVATCQGTPSTLTNTTINNGLTISSWYWDFGDGQSSLVQQPGPHGYLGAADYTVQLKALASNGCRDSITKIVTVSSYPVAAVTANAPLTFCKGDSVTLSVPLNNEYLYTWKIDGVSITNAASAKFVAKLTGAYTAEVINPKGNCKTVSSSVNIVALIAPPSPLISAGGPLTFCLGDSVILSVANTPGYIYQWKNNGGATGSNSNKYIAKNGGNYTLTVSNSYGCSVSSVNSVAITVNPIPVVGAISLDGKKRFCSGGSVTLSVPSTSGYTYLWKNTDGPIGGATQSSFVVNQSGEFWLEVSSSSGCKVITDPVNVEVLQLPSRPAIDKGIYAKGMCLGESPLTLSVDNIIAGYNYKWYKNGAPLSNSTFIKILEGGTYYLEANLDICSSTRDSLPVSFMVTLPKPDIIAKGPTIWYLSTTSKANYYKWYYNGVQIPGATGNIYIANQKLGIYRVSVSDDFQCFSFSDTIRIPDGVTGIDDADLFAAVNIYPNPTTGIFTIEMDNNVFGELVIDIFSQEGRKIFNIKFEKTAEHFSSQIDMSGQPKGMYILNFAINKYLATRKIVVQ